NDDGTICNGASATLTASGGGTYLWSNAETTASITVSPTSTTTYTVTVTLNGCTTTVQQVITVNPLPSASITIAETSGTANNDGTICAGASVTLTASGGSSYLWSTMETTASITVTPSATTTYMVLVTNSNNCSTTTSQAIIVDPLPTPSITVAETSGLTNNDGTVCSGDPVTLTASGGGTYLWSNSETTAAITVNPSATTTYTVTVTNASNCSATATQVITVVSCNDISGKIIWEGDRLTTMTGVNEVTVTLSGDASDVDITGIPGTYMVSGGTGSNFVVTPKKNKPMPGAINGLSSADASRIQQHVIGAFPITDSYKLIAADANKNNSVTAADANLITQAILGNPVAQNWFSNNTWRFVPKAYVFPVPTSPWGFPETITLTGGASDQDFIGCKLGDVNTTANPANFAGSVVPELIWSVQDKLVQAGEEFTIDFNANGFDELLALQFALRFDPEKLQMLEVLPLNGGPLQTGNFGLFNLAGGEIRSVLAMTQTMSWPEGATAFQIRFKALENNVLLSDVLNLDASIIDCESYTADYTKGTVGLVFEGISTDVSTLTDAGLSLLQNRPNPFRDETLIGFVLPADCEVQLRIFDASGRLVAEQKGQFNRGYNALRFELGGVEQGLLYYELVTPFGTRARKMVLARE
ncbi:MAG: hypothetical protein IT259_00960, partial [Saprospiraceae bacterium]|nr:hypothetical protein [Saprospiraceae bacterium]